MNRAVLALLVLGLLVLAAACDGDDEGQVTDEDTADVEEADEADEYAFEDQPDDAAVFFESPEAGATVSSPVELEFEVEGVDLTEVGAPAVGEGHIHVLVDQGCLDEGEFVPGPGDEAEADGVFHLSDGQSEEELDLEAGERELCAQIGDGVHQTFGQTDQIQITVE